MFRDNEGSWMWIFYLLCYETTALHIYNDDLVYIARKVYTEI